MLTVITADGTSHNVTVTISGGEDAPVVSGATLGTVVEDGTLVASGTLTVSDADSADNPVNFADQASIPGDNGYGDFQMAGGNWTYTLNNDHIDVQALDAGASLTDTHTFIASDGTSQEVSVAIAGAAEAVAPGVQPPAPAPAPEPIPELTPEPVVASDPVPVIEASFDPPVEPSEEDLSAPEPPANRTDPSAGEPDGEGLTDFGFNPSLPAPLEPDEILLTVINEARPDRAWGIQETTAAVTKPTAETAQTFLQELKSFWQQDTTANRIEMSEVRLSQAFWDGIDKMQSDMDESVEEQDRKMRLSTEAAAGLGVSLTAGFVSWALRAGSMAASFLTAMPVWRNLDPMPILGADEKAREEAASNDAEDEKSREVDDLFER